MTENLIWTKPPKTRPTRPGYVELVRAWSYYSARLDQKIEIPALFEFDWDSLKRWMPLSYAWLKGRAMVSALIHDDLYRYQRDGKGNSISRKTADLVFWDAMVAEEVAWRHRTAIYYGVRLGGAGAWRRYRRQRHVRGVD